MGYIILPTTKGDISQQRIYCVYKEDLEFIMSLL